VGFQPNRLVLEDDQLLVIENFSHLPKMRLSFRPARKRLFSEEPNVPNLSVELSKPAFAALVRKDDIEATPLLVLETETVSAGIRELYRNADIPFVEVDGTGSRGLFRFERAGFSAKLQFDSRGEDQAVESVIRWSETAPKNRAGRLVRSEVERVVFEALASFAEEMGLNINHQVPFGYAVGYRPDFPKQIARHTIEMVLSLNSDVNPQIPIVLPLRIVSALEGECYKTLTEEDQCIVEYVCTAGMPMGAIQQVDKDVYKLTYSVDDVEEMNIPLNDVDRWRTGLRKFVEHALCSLGLAQKEESTDSLDASNRSESEALSSNVSI